MGWCVREVTSIVTMTRSFETTSNRIGSASPITAAMRAFVSSRLRGNSFIDRSGNLKCQRAM
jgi:hypothetical protein